MNLSFACTAAVYLTTPCEEREHKTRAILNMSGLKSYVYYLGLLTADIVLYLPPMICLILIIIVVDIKIYSTNLGTFAILCAGFGPALITCTYALSHIFKSANFAALFLLLIYVLVGTAIPFTLLLFLHTK